MSKAKFDAARELIQEKKYQEARLILNTIDHPNAAVWLKKLDEIDPSKRKRANPLIFVAALLAVSVLFIVGILFIRERANGASHSTQIVEVPTLLVLPSITAIPPETLTDTPTITPTATPSPTNTPLPPTNTPLPSNTPLPTNTLLPSDTPLPTLTFTPTFTRTPTFTPIPTATRTPTPAPQVAQIGPIYDSLYDTTVTVEVSLNSVQFSTGGGYENAPTGMVYAIVDVTLRNLGPGALHFVGPMSFQIQDSNGAIRSNTFIFFQQCNFDFVDLVAGGSVRGCIAFLVPQSGNLSFIYAPYQYESLSPGRYIQFVVRI